MEGPTGDGTLGGRPTARHYSYSFRAYAIDAEAMVPLARVGDGKQRPAGLCSFLIASSVATLAGDSGTLCSRPPFMRSAEMRHSAASRSISLRLAPRASPDRTAVSIVNRRQRRGDRRRLRAARPLQ